MPMSLDEAIKHATDKSYRLTGDCAAEHRQLAEWLRELRDWRNGARTLLPQALDRPIPVGSALKSGK